MASLIFLAGITIYACEKSYWSYTSSQSYIYWPIFLLVLPHYYQLIKIGTGNFLRFHNWVIPLSLTIVFGTIATSLDQVRVLGYFSLFGIFSLIGNLVYFKNQKLFDNAYYIIGTLGTIILLLSLSFDGYWRSVKEENILILENMELITSPGSFASTLLFLIALLLLSIQIKNRKKDLKPISTVFIIIGLVTLLAINSTIAVVLINLLILGLGIYTVVKGTKDNHLGIMNFGLLIITTLVICRFFDTNLTFILRGILFVAVGVGFFFSNYLMLKKRNTYV
jgi:hypothetical protein